MRGKLLAGAMLVLAMTLPACATDPALVTVPPGGDRQVQVPALMNEALVPGLQIATIEAGEVSVRSYGVARADAAAPVTNETVFEAASLSKPVFAYGVLLLANDGRIDLDAPIGRYVANLSVNQAQTTARQLLSHTAALSSNAEVPPSTPDERRFSYSSEGYNLLQRVVEQITSQPIQQYMQTAVFGPLGMASSSYVWRPDYQSRKASGHAHVGSWAGRSRISQARVASSLETTAGDYARFLIAAVRGAGLSPALHAEFLRPAVALEDCVTCTGRPAGPRSQHRHWALGFGREETAGQTFIWHWGDNQTMQSYAAIRVDGSNGIVILTNSANGHSIARGIASAALSIDAPGYEWVGSYASYLEPDRRLLSKVVRQGLASVTDQDVALPRPQLLRVAERLITGGRAEAATILLRRAMQGESGNAAELALLAEAERVGGDFTAARLEARRALGLDPTNAQAKQVLERVTQAERVIPADMLARFAGVYESPFGELTVRARPRGLRAQLVDQPESAMLPLSDRTFLMEAIGVPIEFVAGPDGAITHAVVRAGGDFRLPKLRSSP